jgi:hypothetical protein
MFLISAQKTKGNGCRISTGILSKEATSKIGNEIGG